MKKLLLICLSATLGQFCFALDPAEGFWFSVDEKSGKITAAWEIYESGGVLYGKMVSLTEGKRGDDPAVKCKKSYQGFPVTGAVNEMPITGTPWIFGLRKKGEGAWTGGYVVNPEDGNMYKCKITIHPAEGSKAETLEMRGEIGLGIGRSQQWRRCTREEAANLR
jgi:uncharacterized protein (DUF2147 family)